MAELTSEITFELPAEEVAVLDGYCIAKNIKRKAVIRELLKVWSADQLHVATIVCRVAGVKQDATGGNRNE